MSRGPLKLCLPARWLPKLLDVASEELNVKKVTLPFLSDAAGRQGHKGSQPFPHPSSVLVAVGAAVRQVMAPTHTLGPCHKRAHISRERVATPVSGSSLVLMQVSACRARPHLLPPPCPSS